MCYFPCFFRFIIQWCTIVRYLSEKSGKVTIFSFAINVDAFVAFYANLIAVFWIFSLHKAALDFKLKFKKCCYSKSFADANKKQLFRSQSTAVWSYLEENFAVFSPHKLLKPDVFSLFNHVLQQYIIIRAKIRAKMNTDIVKVLFEDSSH